MSAPTRTEGSGVVHQHPVHGRNLAPWAPPVGWNPLLNIAARWAAWADDPDWAKPADGGSVSSWRNVGSVGDRPALQATASLQPKWVAAAVNGRAGVVGDGGDYLRTAAWTDRAQPYTLVIVGSMAANQILLDGHVSNRRHQIGSDVNGRLSLYAGSYFAASSGSTTTPQLITAFVSGTGSKLLVNGTEVAAGNAGNHASIGLNLLSRFDGAQGSTGAVAFVAMYAGDVRTNPSWPALKRELGIYYGLTVV